MKLSESLRRGIMETSVGSIVNKFKVPKRRDTLFFEELLARYILECEKGGFSAETRKMGEKWGLLCSGILIPKTFKRIPSVFLLNNIIRKIWHNLGLVDDLHAEKNGKILKLTTKNETMTRFIGLNSFIPGFFMGTIEVLFNSSVNILEMKRKGEHCIYVFKLTGDAICINGRTKEAYMKLNNVASMNGYTLKDVLKKNILTFKENNRIYFRGKSISPVENTVFHIVSDFNVLPEKMSEISYEFFKGIVKERANKDEKLSLLKTLFQVMGWGLLRVLIKEDKKIIIEIRHPPHGLGLNDNWNYVFRTFLGYLWLVDKRLKISNVKETVSSISVEYSR